MRRVPFWDATTSDSDRRVEYAVQETEDLLEGERCVIHSSRVSPTRSCSQNFPCSISHFCGKCWGSFLRYLTRLGDMHQSGNMWFFWEERVTNSVQYLCDYSVYAGWYFCRNMAALPLRKPDENAIFYERMACVVESCVWKRI